MMAARSQFDRQHCTFERAHPVEPCFADKSSQDKSEDLMVQVWKCRLEKYVLFAKTECWLCLQ